MSIFDIFRKQEPNVQAQVYQKQDDTFSFSQEDIYGYQFSAILDEDTCEECKFLDGMVIAPNDRAFITYKPPLHPNCRCIWVGIHKAEEDKPSITGVPSRNHHT